MRMSIAIRAATGRLRPGQSAAAKMATEMAAEMAAETEEAPINYHADSKNDTIAATGTLIRTLYVYECHVKIQGTDSSLHCCSMMRLVDSEMPHQS